MTTGRSGGSDWRMPSLRQSRRFLPSFVIVMATLGCALVVAVGAGEPALGAILVVAAVVDGGVLVAAWSDLGRSPERARVQSERLAAGVNAVDRTPSSVVVVRDGLRSPYSVSWGKQPRLMAPLSLVRRLDDQALRGLAALMLSRLQDTRFKRRTKGRLVVSVVCVCVIAAVGEAIVPGGYAFFGGFGTLAFSAWLLRNGWTLQSHTRSAREEAERMDGVAATLAGGRGPVVSALEAILSWRREGLNRGTTRIGAVIVCLAVPISADGHIEARIQRLTQTPAVPLLPQVTQPQAASDAAVESNAAVESDATDRLPTRAERWTGNSLVIGGGGALIVSVVVVRVLGV
jgi:hypothetical protein